MPKIVYMSHGGQRHEVELNEGVSVMQGAIAAGLDGIVAECGGNLMCATCHVYVEPSQLSILVPMGEDENALLDNTASERKSNSRLSCQLKVSSELDGLIVHMPESQQ